MKRKLLIAAACLAFLALAIFAVSRGSKRMRHEERGQGTFTVTVDLPKSNAAPAKPAGSVR